MLTTLVPAPQNIAEFKDLIGSMMPGRTYKFGVSWMRIDRGLNTYTWSNERYRSKPYKSLTGVRKNLLAWVMVEMGEVVV